MRLHECYKKNIEQGENAMDISKKDWKLFQEKLPDWQENYMEGLIKDYVDFLRSNTKHACLGKKPEFVNVYDDIEQRNFFSFYNYEYYLDVQRQNKIYTETISLDKGLKESAEWYLANETEVNKKPYFDYIDANISPKYR